MVHNIGSHRGYPINYLLKAKLEEKGKRKKERTKKENKKPHTHLHSHSTNYYLTWCGDIESEARAKVVLYQALLS